MNMTFIPSGYCVKRVGHPELGDLYAGANGAGLKWREPKCAVCLILEPTTERVVPINQRRRSRDKQLHLQLPTPPTQEVSTINNPEKFDPDADTIPEG